MNSDTIMPIKFSFSNDDIMFTKYIRLGLLQDQISKNNSNDTRLIDIAKERCLLSVSIKNFNNRINNNINNNINNVIYNAATPQTTPVRQ